MIISEITIYYMTVCFFLNHSTEYAAIELTDKVLTDIDVRNISLAIFMDPSKAFETLDRSILIDNLAYHGIHGTALKWFTSYLTGRSQYVGIDGVSFNILSLSTGVPHGSIQGPSFFLDTRMTYQIVQTISILSYIPTTPALIIPSKFHLCPQLI